jgi:hypothetical protein
MNGEREWAEAFGVELDDDTAGRTEPETVDVYAEQGEADWSREARSDSGLSDEARAALELDARRRRR